MSHDCPAAQPFVLTVHLGNIRVDVVRGELWLSLVEISQAHERCTRQDTDQTGRLICESDTVDFLCGMHREHDFTMFPHLDRPLNSQIAAENGQTNYSWPSDYLLGKP